MSKLLPQIALGQPDYRIRRDSLLEFRLIDLVAKLISLRKQGTADACLTQRLDEAANFLTCPVSRPRPRHVVQASAQSQRQLKRRKRAAWSTTDLNY